MVVHNLANRLVDSGHSVRCIYLKNKMLKKQPLELGLAKYQAVWLKVLPGVYPWILKRYLKKYLKKNKVDVLISTGAEGSCLKRICKKNNIFHIASYHSPNPVYVGLKDLVGLKYLNPENIGKWLHKFDLYLESVSLNKANLICCVSNYQKKTVLQIFKIPQDKITVVYNGVDTKRFFPGKAKTKYRLFYGGGLIWHKGADNLFEALALAVKKHSDILLDIIGLGDWEVYRKKAQNLGILENICYHGYVSYKDVEKYYQKASIFISPTKHEGFSLMIPEAMACGLPIVATNVSSIPEIIRHGINGFLIPFNDPDALAKAILVLLDNPEKIQSMGIAARQTVEQDFTWEKCAQQFEKMIYNHLKEEY